MSGGEHEGRAVAVRGRPRHSVESCVRQFVDDPKAGSARCVRDDRERHGAFKERRAIVAQLVADFLARSDGDRIGIGPEVKNGTDLTGKR